MKFLLILATTMASIFSYGQELNSNANNIKTNFPTEYQKTIRANAVAEWGSDHNMVVFQINLQSDELMTLLRTFKSVHSDILYNAIVNWSTAGYEAANKQIWNNMSTFSLANALKFNVNWQMVNFEYDMQVKAANAY